MRRIGGDSGQMPYYTFAILAKRVCANEQYHGKMQYTECATGQSVDGRFLSWGVLSIDQTSVRVVVRMMFVLFVV